MIRVHNIYYFADSIGNKLGTQNDLGIPDQALGSTHLTTFLNGVYFVAGFIAVLMMVIGGISYITSTGDSGKVTKAKNTIIYAAIGLVFVALAFFITDFILVEATKS